MHSNWQNFLQTQGAVIEQNRVEHYGNLTKELKYTQTDTVLMDRSHAGLICFSGDDARSFLQNQLSCDVGDIGLNAAQYGSCCTPKGRMLATFVLWQSDGTFYMQLPESMVTSMIKRLSMYVLRAKVTITDANENFIRIGLVGKQSHQLVEKYTGSSFDIDPACCLNVIHYQQAHVICHNANRFEFFLPPEQAPELWEQLRQYAKPVGSNSWDWLEIRDGIPIILPVTQEQFIPQMVNLEAIGGVSFKKGCYPGQEIVARTQHIGKIKRRMYLAHIASGSADVVVMPGDELFGDALADQSCGKIVNSAPAPDGGFDVLAVIQVSSKEAGNIYWQSTKVEQLEIIPLPYSID